MKCSDVERVLPELLDGAPDGASPSGDSVQADLETHLKSCPACADLISDLKLIAGEARQLAATEEPAARVWLRIAAELRAEGLIREPEPAPARPVLVPTFPRRRWTSTAWWLAPVAAAALVVAGSYVVSHRPAPPVAKQQAPAPAMTSPAAVTSPTSEAAATPSRSVPAPAPQQLAQSAKPAGIVESAVPPAVEPGPSEEDQQFLSVVSTLAPAMRATYENELQAVNADIRETQAYVNRNPADADARQHLMDAYQEKALLYQIAMDRIQ